LIYRFVELLAIVLLPAFPPRALAPEVRGLAGEAFAIVLLPVVFPEVLLCVFVVAMVSKIYILKLWNTIHVTGVT
jgi:hypothetical protein